MVKMLQAGLCVAILIVGVGSQANGNNDQDSQNCRGDSQANPASNVTTAPSGTVASSPKPHSVTLSWNPSIPASNSPGDAIQGYNVYRRKRGKEYEKINIILVQISSADLIAFGKKKAESL